MNIILIGDSGHARVVAEILASQGQRVVAKLDDKYEALFKREDCWYGPVADVHSLIEKEKAKVIVAIGNNAARKKIVERLSLKADHFATAVHQSAVISPSASLGHGTVVMAGVVVNSEALVGDHVILNSRSVVEHDCRIGDFVHVSPGAAIAGLAKLGEGVLIETGASVIPARTIGQWSTVRAGSAVMEDVGQFATVIGVPAYVVEAEELEKAVAKR